jgi:aminomethyltransferase
MTDLVRTQLWGWHSDHGANLVNFGGWDMPLWYETGAVREHMAVIQAAGMFDTSHMSVVMVSGPSAYNLLQNTFTRDLEDVRPGRCVYGAFLKDNGHCLDDAVVGVVTDNEYMVVVNSGMGRVLKDHLESIGAGPDVCLENLTGKLGKLDIQGPRAGQIIQRVLLEPDAVLREMPYFSFKGHFRNSDHVEPVLLKDRTPVLLSRSGYTGEFGFELFMAPDKVNDFWYMIGEAGQDYGLIPCGLAARDSLRAGAGLPLSHQDIGDWPFINNPWFFALPFNRERTGFTKPFIGDGVLDMAQSADHTVMYAGYDPRKVALHGEHGEPSVVLDESGREIGVVLTCVADMAVGRVDGRIVSVAGSDKPENFKPKGLVCGFIKVKERPEIGRKVVLRDHRRSIEVEIVGDVRPHRTARGKLETFL